MANKQELIDVLATKTGVDEKYVTQTIDALFGKGDLFLRKKGPGSAGLAASDYLLKDAVIEVAPPEGRAVRMVVEVAPRAPRTRSTVPVRHPSPNTSQFNRSDVQSGEAPALRLGFGKTAVELPSNQKSGSRPVVVTMTDLGQQAGRVIGGIEEGVPALLTKRGRIVAAIVPLDADSVEAALLARVRLPDTDVAREFDVLPRNRRLATISEVAESLGLGDPGS